MACLCTSAIAASGPVAEITGGGLVKVRTTVAKEPDSWSLSSPMVTSAGKKRSSLGSAVLADQPRVESGISITVDETLALVNEFQQRSDVFQATGGVHSAALCDTRSIIV